MGFAPESDKFDESDALLAGVAEDAAGPVLRPSPRGLESLFLNVEPDGFAPESERFAESDAFGVGAVLLSLFRVWWVFFLCFFAWVWVVGAVDESSCATAAGKAIRLTDANVERTKLKIFMEPLQVGWDWLQPFLRESAGSRIQKGGIEIFQSDNSPALDSELSPKAFRMLAGTLAGLRAPSRGRPLH